MKHEYDIEKPPYLQEAWPGKYQLFSWQEYAVNIPYPIFIVTTLKENGKPNACLHSWGCFAGGDQGYCSVLTMLKTNHTAANILRAGEWCINFPSVDLLDRCVQTIACNSPDSDEIAESGFTLEVPRVVQAPRIAECAVNLECKLEWDHPLCEGSDWHVFTGKVVHLAMEELAFELDPAQRMKNLKTMYNMRATLNPQTGEIGQSLLPVIGEM